MSNLYKISWLESWRLPNRRKVGRYDIGRRRKQDILLFNDDGFYLRKLYSIKNTYRKNKRVALVVRFERKFVVGGSITIIAVVNSVVMIQKLPKRHRRVDFLMLNEM